MKNDWEFADKPDSAKASSDGREICFTVQGTKPAPCYEVRIVQGPEDIWPPIFYLQWQQEGTCPQVLSPYEIRQCLPLGGKVEWVTLQYRDGSIKVEVAPEANS